MTISAGNSTQTPTSDDEIQGPAIVTPLHAQDRATSKVAGAPLAWRKRSQLEVAFQAERLGARDSSAALARLDAGNFYAQLYDASQSPSRDSTEAFDCTGTVHRMPYGEAQANAVRHLVAIEMRLGERDKIIARSVCWFGYTPAEAIVRARLPRDTRVSARLCESLDALADAIERSSKRLKRKGPR